MMVIFPISGMILWYSHFSIPTLFRVGYLQSNFKGILLFIPVYQILCCPVTVATLVDQTKREITKIFPYLQEWTRVCKGDVYCSESCKRLPLPGYAKPGMTQSWLTGYLEDILVTHSGVRTCRRFSRDVWIAFNLGFSSGHFESR